MQSVMCALDPIRCWQLAGAVLRGIQIEIPRVVATMWVEQTGGGSTDGASYSHRIDTPGALREILMERLESSLPGNSQMRLDFHPDGVPNYWDMNDIMITNQGITCPRIPSISDSALEAMLQSIFAGEAGNPVFTDSMRTE
jgi:hypothetical protein